MIDYSSTQVLKPLPAGRGGDLAGTSMVTRIKSALDVLADQAPAAFDDDSSISQVRPEEDLISKEKKR